MLVRFEENYWYYYVSVFGHSFDFMYISNMMEYLHVV